MKYKNYRISVLKTWISQTPEGRAKLTKLHQTMKQELKDLRKENTEVLDYQY
jgi:hypothetical protein|tara:strand:+ start:220 stop:375 length:156 start_codon:yes stop_codon:yes gene_type:complete